MADKPMTREKAIVWWIVLFVVSVLGTALWISHKYHSARLWLGLPLNTALFVCASVWGMGARPEEIKKGLGPGLKALPVSQWALAVAVIELLLWILVGWKWFWRSPAILALGLVSGCIWAQQEQPPAAPEGEGEEPPPVDLWKP